MEFEELKKEMISQKEQAIRDLGNQGKKDREIFTVYAFLRCLNVPFQNNEIIPVADQFPDILFRDAIFEIKELMDPGRKRLDEYKKTLNKIKASTSLRDLMEQYTPVDYSLEAIYDKVQFKVTGISNHYSIESRNSSDLIIYFNLLEAIVPDPKNSKLISFDAKGWRSISVVGSSWAYVIESNQNAPKFLQNNMHCFKRNYGAWD